MDIFCGVHSCAQRAVFLLNVKFNIGFAHLWGYCELPDRLSFQPLVLSTVRLSQILGFGLLGNALWASGQPKFCNQEKRQIKLELKLSDLDHKLIWSSDSMSPTRSHWIVKDWTCT
ncbi:unnamed protein product [Ostreobium quekettii]|uniref:Uncharacterized protein n=1 Tax=Ostreobium quekettii TaxID=121088 RepID=A0A8S1JDJ0_9CHLO|nr:unnamed protein product [Ostreobium quekettii]